MARAGSLRQHDRIDRSQLADLGVKVIPVEGVVAEVGDEDVSSAIPGHRVSDDHCASRGRLAVAGAGQSRCGSPRLSGPQSAIIVNRVRRGHAVAARRGKHEPTAGVNG